MLDLLYWENKHETVRLLADYPPTVWGYSFASLACHDSEFQSYTEEVELLKEKIKDMLIHYDKNLIQKIELIDLLCRLDVSYHFENEIKHVD
uniref:Terpene synthase N-terminal domain-containing protein n=1 Tax=Manihot esculenta TaxID=3983 RepID=A0A2C9WEF3_MANES